MSVNDNLDNNEGGAGCNTKIQTLLLELVSSRDRENALSELSKMRDTHKDLPNILWHSFGVMSILLQEVVSIYPLLNQPTLSAATSTRVCNALILMQCVASDENIRPLFINAQFPLYLYPILNTTIKTRPFEHLRLACLGAIGTLIKHKNTEIISFLITTEIIPLCLRIMEFGSEVCKTVAIFVVQKTLADDLGLDYICQAYERLYAVVTVLNSMTLQMEKQPSARLLKHTIKCYLRLSENKRVMHVLRQHTPKSFYNDTFSSVVDGDSSIKEPLLKLISNLKESH